MLPKIGEKEAAEVPVYYHESGDLFAKDIEQHMAVLPEMTTATEEVTIDDIQIGDPMSLLPQINKSSDR